MWRNKEALLFHRWETVAPGLIQGKRLPECAKAIADKLGQPEECGGAKNALQTV